MTLHPSDLLDASLLPAGGRVAVACSGGRDSMVLLHGIARRIRDRVESLEVVHVDHGLREDSADDARHVVAVAEHLGLPVTLRNLALESGASEDAARRARYAAFASVADARRLTSILLGHHQGDQWETIVMRVSRRAGLKGLAGIPPRRPLTSDCELLRPLIHAHPAEIALAASHVSFRDDPTNFSLRFERNRIRLETLPALNAAHPDIATRLLRVGTLAARAHGLVVAMADEISASLLLHEGDSLSVLDAARLAILPDPVRHELLDRNVRRLLGRALSGRGAERLEETLRSHASRAQEVQDALSAHHHRGRLWLARRAERNAHDAEAFVTAGLGGRFQIQSLTSAEAVFAALQRALNGGLAHATIAGESPVWLRPSRRGDVYHPLNGPGKKRVSELLGKAAVPPGLRLGWPLLVDEEGPLWTPGAPPAHRRRVRNDAVRGWSVRWVDSPLDGQAAGVVAADPRSLSDRR